MKNPPHVPISFGPTLTLETCFNLLSTLSYRLMFTLPDLIKQMESAIILEPSKMHLEKIYKSSWESLSFTIKLLNSLKTVNGSKH